MFAGSPSTIIKAAFGRLHNGGPAAEGCRPTVVESIMVDGEPANLANIFCDIWTYVSTVS